jgi:hypothetical protein
MLVVVAVVFMVGELRTAPLLEQVQELVEAGPGWFCNMRVSGTAGTANTGGGGGGGCYDEQYLLQWCRRFRYCHCSVAV